MVAAAGRRRSCWWTLSLIVLWLLLLACCIAYHVAWSEVAPSLRRLPANIRTGFYDVLGFARLEQDVTTVQGAAAQALQLCGVDAYKQCVGCLAPNANVNGKTSNSALQRKEIEDSFKSSLDQIRRVGTDPYYGTGVLQHGACLLNWIWTNATSIRVTELPCNTTSKAYCCVFLDATWLLSVAGEIQNQVALWADRQEFRKFEGYARYLVFLHSFPYVLVIAMVILTGAWVRDVRCCCCRRNHQLKEGRCALLLYAFFWLVSFLASAAVCALALAARFGMKYVKLRGVQNEPTLQDYVSHMRAQYPAFWSLIWGEMADGLQDFVITIFAFLALGFLVLLYSACMCCQRPTKPCPSSDLHSSLLELTDRPKERSIPDHGTRDQEELMKKELSLLQTEAAALEMRLAAVRAQEQELAGQLHTKAAKRAEQRLKDALQKWGDVGRAPRSTQKNNHTNVLGCTFPEQRKGTGVLLLDAEEMQHAKRQRADSADAILVSHRANTSQGRRSTSRSHATLAQLSLPRHQTLAGTCTGRPTSLSVARRSTRRSRKSNLSQKHTPVHKVSVEVASGNPMRLTQSCRRDAVDEERWLDFLAGAADRLRLAGVVDEPAELFETFRASEDLGVIYASFARLFHLATAPSQHGGLRKSNTLTVAPPWAAQAPGRNWRHAYEPMRLMLAGVWKAKRLWKLLDARCGRLEYTASPPPCGAESRLEGQRCLVVGAGPCGLRAAIELRLLGAQVTIVERRTQFSRINQLHLWSWCGEELKQLGARCLQPPPLDFAANPDKLHISIGDLQTLLIKVALLLGVEVLLGVDYCQSEWTGESWLARLQPSSAAGAPDGRAVPISPHAPSEIRNLAVLVGASGLGCTIGKDAGMTMIETNHMKAESAIGLVCNFERTLKSAEAKLRSFSMARQFYAQLFKQVELNTGAELENIVYSKGHQAHYFVMTPTRRCLCENGVVTDASAPILARGNVNASKLDAFVRRVTAFPFKNEEPAVYEALLEDQGAAPSYADNGPVLFDFSKMCRSLDGLLFVPPPDRDSDDSEEDKEDGNLLVALVGDALIEPFWPEGLGISRGFFGVLDACSAIAEWASGEEPFYVIQHFQEAYAQLKSLSAATRARVLQDETLVNGERAYGLSPHSRYRIFDPESRQPNFSPEEAAQRRTTRCTFRRTEVKLGSILHAQGPAS